MVVAGGVVWPAVQGEQAADLVDGQRDERGAVLVTGEPGRVTGPGRPEYLSTGGGSPFYRAHRERRRGGRVAWRAGRLRR